MPIHHATMFGLHTQKSMKKRAPQKSCECVRGKKVGSEELDEKDWLPSILGCGFGVGLGVGLCGWFKKKTGAYLMNMTAPIPYEVLQYKHQRCLYKAKRIGGGCDP